MRTSDVDILIVPGWSSSGPDHWQSRWERSLKTARRVEQDDWKNPSRAAWVGRLVEAVSTCQKPPVLVAHSLGVTTVAHAADALRPLNVAGAFLVAPADADLIPAGDGFAPAPRWPLPFPSMVIASTDDPHCSIERAREFAGAWGAPFVEAGALGHINAESGHGPWPEGLLKFGAFLKALDRVAPSDA